MTIEQILDAIERMTVAELVRFTTALSARFGVDTKQPPSNVVYTLMGDRIEISEEEPNAWSVYLVNAGDQRVQVIKAVREILHLGLKESKDIVDRAPVLIATMLPTREEADAIASKLHLAGAEVTLESSQIALAASAVFRTAGWGRRG